MPSIYLGHPCAPQTQAPCVLLSQIHSWTSHWHWLALVSVASHQILIMAAKPRQKTSSRMYLFYVVAFLFSSFSSIFLARNILELLAACGMVNQTKRVDFVGENVGRLNRLIWGQLWKYQVLFLASPWQPPHQTTWETTIAPQQVKTFKHPSPQCKGYPQINLSPLGLPQNNWPLNFNMTFYLYVNCANHSLPCPRRKTSMNPHIFDLSHNIAYPIPSPLLTILSLQFHVKKMVIWRTSSNN